MLKTIIDNDTFFDVVKSELGVSKTVSFTVKGQSMWPFYKDGKTIVTVESPKQLKKYDVVLATYQDKVILHRIIQIQGDTYILRGDATTRKEVVKKTDIFGRVLQHQTQKITQAPDLSHRMKVWFWVNNPLRTLLLRLRAKK